MKTERMMGHMSRLCLSILRPRHNGWTCGWALLIAFLFIFARPHIAQAASCGEPDRNAPVDVDKNGVIERTVVLDQCLIRTFEYAGVDKTILVYWTTTNGIASDRLRPIDTNGDSNPEMTPGIMAFLVAGWTERAWITYRNWGHPDPQGRNDFKVHIMDMDPGLWGWCCTEDAYVIDAPMLLNSLGFGGSLHDGESTVYHEMWHASIGDDYSAWAVEGGAARTEDMMTPELDRYVSSAYMGRVKSYLLSGHRTNLENHAYVGALWWTYFAEQVGAELGEPARGWDAISDFYKLPAGSAHTRMDTVIRARGKGNFNSLWMNFAVANYTKELTDPALPARMRYVDERQPNAPDYPVPVLDREEALLVGTPIGPIAANIEPWSSRYYQFNTGATGVPVINVQVRQEAGRPVGYALLAIRNNMVVRETQHIGSTFNQVWVNDNYERVVLIVIGLSEASSYRYSVNATTPRLNIVDPTQARPVSVGRHDVPEKLLIKINVFADGVGTPLLGLDPNTITIRIGDQTVPASGRISGAFVQDQYWLLVRAPAQSAVGVYDLTVTWGDLTDKEFNAVWYAPRADSDNMIVLDRSGSMEDFGKMLAAKNAARLYVDSWRAGDMVGVASFSDDATLNLTLRPWETGRMDALNSINGITTDNNTSIGDGAKAGLDELVARGSNAHRWAIILLSDGLENEPITVQDYLNLHAARANGAPPQQVPAVHAIALGPDADRAKMEKLAADTGGSYFVVALPAVASAAGEISPAAIDAAYLVNDLAETYRVASEAVARQQQVYAQVGYLSDVEPVTHTITVDGAASEAVFVLKWSKHGVGETTLLQPDGTAAPPPDVTDETHRLWRIPAPQAGVWQLVIYSYCDGCGNEALVEAAVTSDLDFDLYLGLSVEQRLVGKPMPIYATLADSAPIVGATISALINAPANFLYSVPLYDDGNHGDGATNDGFYGGTFYNTHGFGGYDMVVTATGTDNNGIAFVRRLRAGFNMLQFRLLGLEGIDPNIQYDPNNPAMDPYKPYIDKDDDAVIDWWEIEWGLDPELTNPNTRFEDPDRDGFNNDDEYNRSTNPLRSDTDGGGENDQSESGFGTDPNNPADDMIACPLSFSTANVHQHGDFQEQVGGVVLNYDVNPEHSYFFIWRSETMTGTLELLTDSATTSGHYHDETVPEGATYYYWLSAYDAEGHASCILGPISGTATADGLPPDGVVTINNWMSMTISNSVALNLEASYDVTEMQVSNTPDFSAGNWEPYATEKPWELAPVDGVGSVHVLYRDAAGNVSEPAYDTIFVQEPEQPEEKDEIYLPKLRH